MQGQLLVQVAFGDFQSHDRMRYLLTAVDNPHFVRKDWNSWQVCTNHTRLPTRGGKRQEQNVLSATRVFSIILCLGKT